MAYDGLTILKQLKTLHNKQQHPNFPYPPPPKYSDKTANGLTKCIVDFLNLSGHQAERISNMGRYIDNSKVVTDAMGFRKKIGTGKYIPGSGTKGTADISATIKGKSVKIEVKIGKDRQSEAQKKYQESVERSEGVYVIARTFQEFYEYYLNELL